MIWTWMDGYALERSVFDFSKDRDLIWPMSVMTPAGLPATAKHMDVCESYPSTFDAVAGNYS